MPICEIKEVADWLIDGARSAPQPAQVLAQLSERLLACGVPLWRVAVFVRTLHPQVMGRRFIWRPGTEVEVSEAPFELLESADFLENPIAQVYATGRALRRKLADPDCPMDFPVLSELRAEGITDYLASPLVFTDGAIHAVTCLAGHIRRGDIEEIHAAIWLLTGQLGRAILASGEFARHCAGEFTPLGEFRLAGFSSPQLVFALAVE